MIESIVRFWGVIIGKGEREFFQGSGVRGAALAELAELAELVGSSCARWPFQVAGAVGPTHKARCARCLLQCFLCLAEGEPRIMECDLAILSINQTVKNLGVEFLALARIEVHLIYRNLTNAGEMSISREVRLADWLCVVGQQINFINRILVSILIHIVIEIAQRQELPPPVLNREASGDVPESGVSERCHPGHDFRFLSDQIHCLRSGKWATRRRGSLGLSLNQVIGEFRREFSFQHRIRQHEDQLQHCWCH